ncbi:uncharacterized protein LOC132563365 [Ylistrum balloti]|uniref:uncharacterized protein LOC132563365 n=1 Tax=Ylistrum balloti TaxID=509963 RepID=UPI002905F780|nr:uncharacterized protein LOC132563365 [Ylistrum balloti]
MKTFKHTRNSLLCSDHFADREGPSPINPIPSCFGSKSFRTSKLDENQNDIENEVPEVLEQEIECNISLNSDDSLSSAQGFVTSESVLDTSLRIHDYLGHPDVESYSSIRNQYVQTMPSNRTIGTQTEGDSFVRRFVDADCQTNDETVCVDASAQVSLPILTYDDIKSDGQKLMFYTGIPDADTFDALFDEPRDDAEERTSRSVNGNGTGGRPRILRAIDEFFMVLMRLRLGLLLEDLAFRFCISTSTCGDIFNRWIDFLDSQLSFLVMWPSREAIDSNMPEIFKEKFPTTRVVIDATEIQTETPSSLQLKSLMYSDYKSHMTWKSLVGISPAGVVTYVSDLWCGSISDKQITIESGLVEMCEAGDAIMADKGFTISDLTTPRGCLNKN